MFKKVPALALCLLVACGAEAWGASRPAVMQSPAKDGAYVLELPGLVN